MFTANSQGNERLTVTETKACASSGASPLDTSIPSSSSAATGATNDRTDNESSFDLDSMHQWLDPHLRPVTPDPENQFSQQIFEQHKDLANEYLKVCFEENTRQSFIFNGSINWKVQTQRAYAAKHKERLLAAMDPEQRRERLDIAKKLEERVK